MPLRAYVVEDNPGIRDSLVEALSEIGGIESAGTSGSETAAVAWLRDTANHWDIAVVDLTLERGGSGFGVLQALRGRDSTQKMVVLTGASGPDMRRRCEIMGADGIFDKAMDTEAMLDYCVKLARAAGGH